MTNNRFSFLFYLLVIIVILLLSGCSTENAITNETGKSSADTKTENQGELIVYTSRNENFVNPLLEKFEAETGIKVNALHAGGGAVNRIIEESRNVQADIFISNDVGSLEYLRMEGLLEGFEPSGIETIDSNYRAVDNSWFALSARTRVFIFNKDLITEEEMPTTVWELTDPAWQGKFAITRGGNGGMIAHISALRYEWGDEKTEQWIAMVRENAGAIMEGHGDIRRAVGAGEFAFGLVNNYYYHQQLREPVDNNVGVIYPDQGDGEMGAVVNGAGVALIKDSPNQDNARRFIEWILLPDNQREFSYASLEVPINPDVEAIGEAATIEDYKVQGMPLSMLGDYFIDTKDLIERSGLDLDLR